jgi:hypothetical protein
MSDNVKAAFITAAVTVGLLLFVKGGLLIWMLNQREMDRRECNHRLEHRDSEMARMKEALGD